MSVAQRLYQNGFITYMRTDSTTLSQEGLGGAARAIELKFGKEYLSEKPRLYRTQATNAQEAHEAIRPAGADFREVAQVRRQLGSEAAQLYKLVWQRMLASPDEERPRHEFNRRDPIRRSPILRQGQNRGVCRFPDGLCLRPRSPRTVNRARSFYRSWFLVNRSRRNPSRRPSTPHSHPDATAKET